MDLLKGGWHPPGDKQIHRATWKKDLKNIATRNKDDSSEHVRDHVSTPISSLKDPDSFGPPPKHTAYYPNAQSPTARSGTITGLGAPVPKPAPRPRQKEQEVAAPPPGPYKVNTTGLKTDNLPKPPLRKDGATAASPVNPVSTRPVPASPMASDVAKPVPVAPIAASNARPVPMVPPRQAISGPPPPPILPPRQSETPNEYTPPPPPSYSEANQRAGDTGLLNAGAVNRLGKAGISVAGFGIGGENTSRPSSSSTQGHVGQLSELQQRFARMNASGESNTQPDAAPPSWKQAQAASAAFGGPTTPQAGLKLTSSVANRMSAGNEASSQSGTTTPNWKQAQAVSAAYGGPTTSQAGMQFASSIAAQKKKPPPPPPPAKKSELTSASDAGVPPPIPVLSKPRPG